MTALKKLRQPNCVDELGFGAKRAFTGR